MNPNRTSVLPQVPASHYFGTKYDNLVRFCSYWHQIDETLKLNPSKVLEVGIGSGLVNERLRHYGLDAQTLDIAADLHPDLVGSVTNIPANDGAYEVAICCQVLEHLPYDQFIKALKELRRIASKGCIISLPDARRLIKIELSMPRIGNRHLLVNLPTRARQVPFNGEHYWEIGWKGATLAIVKKDISSVFKIINDYRALGNPYHHFFILQ